MTRINLLPWREDRRNRRKQEYIMTVFAVGALAVLVVIAWAMFMGQRIDNQNSRNAYLQSQIKQLDAKIVEIKSLEKTRDRLLARKKIIEQLQANRSQMVHLFDELVKTIPDSVRLTGMTQTGDNLHLDGVAQSNASVASYMRNLEASPWLGHHADLKKTENTRADSSLPYAFALDMKMSKPSDEEMQKAAAANGASVIVPASSVSTAAPPPDSVPVPAASAATKGGTP
ncbi:MAG: PilN domain-containing protein [Xanthomonadales bacterium]|nr:PilN domain-containing protein [Xanthomonadales bacterium]